MCCNKERSSLKEYYQNSGDPLLRKEARVLHTDLLGACGLAGSYRTHTARLLAGQTIQGAEEMQQIWENKRQEASGFIERHPMSPPSR